MRKPAILELVASGFRGGFSRNGLIAAVAMTGVSVLLPALAIAAGLIPPPSPFAQPDAASVILQLAVIVLTTLASQPFLIGMVEHQFREPSPITTLRVVSRYWLGLLAIGLVGILGGIVLGFVAFMLGKLGLAGRIVGIVLMLGIWFYWLLGTFLLWPAAIYEERFSPWRAFKAMRGLRWRALASVFLLMLPFMLPAMAIVISAWPNSFAMMIKPPLGLWLIATFVSSVASACGFALVAHLYLAQRGSSAPSTPAVAAFDAAGLS